MPNNFNDKIASLMSEKRMIRSGMGGYQFYNEEQKQKKIGKINNQIKSLMSNGATPPSNLTKNEKDEIYGRNSFNEEQATREALNQSVDAGDILSGGFGNVKSNMDWAAAKPEDYDQNDYYDDDDQYGKRDDLEEDSTDEADKEDSSEEGDNSDNPRDEEGEEKNKGENNEENEDSDSPIGKNRDELNDLSKQRDSLRGEDLGDATKAADLGVDAGELASAGEGVAAAEGVAGAEAAAATGAAAAAGETAAAEGTVAFLIANPEIIAVILVVIIILALIAILLLSALFKGNEGKCSSNVSNAGSSQNVIVLDPGHPSEVGKGATSSDGSVKEVEKVFEIANLIKPKLEAKGYTVVLTRTNNTTEVSNKERAELANSKNAALMFRIHDDFRSDGRGFAYYYPAKAGTIGDTTGPSEEVINKSREAAKTILDTSSKSFTDGGMPVYKGGLLTDADTTEGRSHGGALAGSIYSKVPVALIEIGDLNNATDVAWLKNNGNLEKIAVGIADGIAAAVPNTAATAPSSATFSFPVQATTKRAFSGRTKGGSQPRAPSNSNMVRANAADSFYEWPIPDDKGSESNNGEPGYGACRGDACERTHKGVDVYANFGAPVVAPEGGNIVSYGGSAVSDATEAAGGGKGRWLTLKGDSGKSYTFMHLEGYSDAVLKGLGLSDQIGNTSEKSANFAVKSGDIIAYVGNTGGIQNPHLHFQYADGSKDPKPAMDSWLSGTALTATPGSNEECSTVSPSASTYGQKVVELARSQVGKPYEMGACHGATLSSTPPGGCPVYDCSSLVQWAWYWGSDKKFDPGGDTASMWATKDDTSKWTKVPNYESLQAGDILLRDGHVMIASGTGTIIEAMGRKWGVVEGSTRTNFSQYVFLRPVVK